MRTLITLALAAAAAVAPRPVVAQRATWAFELLTGTAWSLGTPLTIRQRGEIPLRTRARYETRPFRDAPYYAYRFARWEGDAGWEAELIHHKLYLANPPAEVERFEVSHGYNMVVANRAERRGDRVTRLGIGLVIAHPETTVRGRHLSGGRSVLGRGYHIAGVTLHVALGGRAAVSRRVGLVGEGKVTAAWARVPIADGWATVPNIAVHALGGVALGSGER